MNDYCLTSSRIVTLHDLMPTITMIEDLVDVQAKEIIKESAKLSEQPTKGDIRRFFQERLATSQVVSMSKSVDESTLKLLNEIKNRIFNNRV